jgi:lysophospholipase L1-like esterase
VSITNMTSNHSHNHGNPFHSGRGFSWLGIVITALTLLVSPACLAQSASEPAKAQAKVPFENEILAFEASDRTNPPPKDAILFIGSSSIRLWKTLAKDFSKHKVTNRGFGGSQIIDSVNYADRIVFPYRPRLIVLYAGGNDINGGKSPDQVFADYKAFVAKVHSALPKTRITYISIAPNPARWAQVERVKATNERIAEHVKTDSRLGFINVFPEMLGPDGQPKPDIYVEDRLHMNAKGYELWTAIVGKYLD